MHVVRQSSFVRGLARFAWPADEAAAHDVGKDEAAHDAGEDEGGARGAGEDEGGARGAAVVCVCGTIGAGKTQLLADARARHGMFALEETIIGGLLADYIDEMARGLAARARGEPRPPTQLSFPLQLAMMQCACARTRAARAFCAQGAAAAAPEREDARYLDPRRCALVERPAAENAVFALANFLAGALTRDEFGLYLEYVHADVRDDQRRGAGAQRLVLLWAPEDAAYDNMIGRARHGEERYSRDAYLDCLNHAYFLEAALNPAFVVLDWSAFGTYADVAACLAHADADRAVARRVMRVREEGLAGGGADVCALREYRGALVFDLNLAAYLAASAAVRRAARTAFFRHIALSPPTLAAAALAKAIVRYAPGVFDAALADQTYQQ